MWSASLPLLFPAPRSQVRSSAFFPILRKVLIILNQRPKLLFVLMKHSESTESPSPSHFISRVFLSNTFFFISSVHIQHIFLNIYLSRPFFTIYPNPFHSVFLSSFRPSSFRKSFQLKPVFFFFTLPVAFQ